MTITLRCSAAIVLDPEFKPIPVCWQGERQDMGSLGWLDFGGKDSAVSHYGPGRKGLQSIGKGKVIEQYLVIGK